jgi:hypothetical protein
VYISGLLYNAIVAPLKVVILMEWMRIFCSHARNAFYWTCQIVMWVNIVYYTCAVIVEALQCTPQSRVWDPLVQGAHCIDTDKVIITTCSVNLVSDLVILMAPQRVIWTLQLSTRKKIGVALIFSVGIM